MSDHIEQNRSGNQAPAGSERPGITRRSALKGAAALCAVATLSTVLPQRAFASANDVTLTAADLASDPSSTIQAAIDQVSAAGGGTVHLPAGSYELSATLRLKSGVCVAGEGMTSTTLRDAADLGANPIFLVLGTDEAPISSCGIRDITVQNGLATTGTAPAGQLTTPMSKVGKDGVYAENVNGLTIRRVLITEIQGLYGFWCKVASNVMVCDSKFYRCTNAMLYVMVDCDTVHVQDNIFDTTTSTSYPQNYTFAMGGDRLNQGQRWATNVWVERNILKNNPYWLGLNSHGGENLYFRHNHVENVFGGIIVGPAVGFVAEPVLKNVVIEKNTFIQGASDPWTVPRLHTGITVAGGSAGVRTDTVEIRHNKVVGFGGGDITNSSVLVERADNTVIADNCIEDFGTYAILLGEGAFGVEICNNSIKNMALVAPGGETISAAISVQLHRSGDGYGVVIDGNRLEADSSAQAPQWFVYAPSQFASWQILSNDIRNTQQAVPYSVVNYLPVERTVEPTDYLTQRYGDKIYNASGQPGWSVVAPASGYGSLDTTTVVVKASIAAGSDILTIVPGGVQDWRSLPPGMNIAIAGAGDAGATLNAMVTEITSTTSVTLDTPAATSVVAADVVYQPLSLATI